MTIPKKITALLLALLAATPLFAQDMIVRRDGTIVASKVMEISSSEIKYKKFTNPDGPLYSLKVSEVLSINFQNGEVERFEQAAEPAPQASSAPKGTPEEPLFIEVGPDESNRALLDRYNNSELKILKRKSPNGKIMDAGYTYRFGFTQNSILSNEDIEVSFSYEQTQIGQTWKTHRDIKLTNKSNEVIYIDLSRCFRTNLDGSSHTYYDGSRQMSVTNTAGTGISVNLGAGISVGGGGARALTTTYTNERILTIPPHSHAYLSTLKMINGKILSGGEPLKFDYFVPWEVERWRVYDFTEENTPGTLRYTITYSKKSDFSTFSQIRFDQYIRQVLGMKYHLIYYVGELSFNRQNCLFGIATANP